MENHKTAWLYCHAEKWEGKEEISRQELILCAFCKSRGLYIHGVSKRIGERKGFLICFHTKNRKLAERQGNF